MLAFKYVAFHYLKYFFIILGALVIFMVGFDYLDNAHKLTKSANLVLIYLAYKSFFAIDTLLPLSLVFAMISTKIYLIRSNALVSFYSLGYSRVDILKPFVGVSTFIIIIFIGLHGFSNFSRADEFSNNIRKYSQYLSPTKDLFFTYKGKYIYFSTMVPLQKQAYGIRVFDVKNGSLERVLMAKTAKYEGDHWVIEKSDLITKTAELDFASKGIEVTQQNRIKILKGFRPKMLDQVYEGKVNFTIKNAIDAILLLEKQNVNVQSIKSALYKIFIYPFFVPCIVVIIFFFVPISVRFLNVSLFSFGAILATLLIWGVLFMFLELAKNKTISSEIGVIAPIVILFFIAVFQYRHYAYKHK